MKKQILNFIVAGGLCLSSAVGIFPSADNFVCEAYTQYASLQKLEIANNKDKIAVGETVQLVPVWGNGAKRELTYTSDNESVASVDETGLVTGVGKGTAVITAAYADIKEPVTINITVDSGVGKSKIYNTSELKLGDKLRKNDTLHYDKKNIGGTANIVNDKGDYDITFISEKDYVLPFDAEVVGFDGTTMYLAPDIKGMKYVDARTLSEGDTVDRDTHLLCYDYHINNMVLPVFLPEYYGKYIGEGVITVKDIDHENKTITLEAETKVKKVIQGDADMNGIVDKADISAIRDRLLKKLDLSENELKTCDMNDDGKLNVVDYLMMKRKLTEKQQNTETYGQAKTPENMPEIIDEYGKVSDKLKEIIWMILKTKYPRTDLSDFKLVNTPEPQTSYDTTGWDFFTVYYKDIPLHEYRSYVADIPQQVGKWINVQLGTDPSVIKSVDTEAECISEDRLHEAIRNAAEKNEEPFVIDTEKQPRKVIYTDTDGKTAKLAYSVLDQNGRSEFVIDAVTGEVLELISYITT